jgi:MFS family permease
VVTSSLTAVLLGTFTLRFSTGLTGALIVYYFADLPNIGGPNVDAFVVGLMAATFYASELILATPFGLLSDRLGHHRVMQFGPVFGAIAVTATWLTTNLVLIGATRILEGASTAASVPSILGFIAAATAGNELLRGRMSARFEGATIAGLGAGFVVAGLLYAGIHVHGGGVDIDMDGIGRHAFLLNALIYMGSFAIYRFGVREPPEAQERRTAPHPGFARYAEILRASHIWLLAPTWIAINAALSLYTSQTVFQLVREPKPGFESQLLMGRFDPSQVSVGLAAGLLVFFGGLVFWGDRFKRYRRTTIILFGIGGGAIMVVAAFLLNHAAGTPTVVRVAELVVLGAGLFVLSGATPAALGLLADVSEAFPADRGAIMGLYSVFLAIGQIAGSLIGGKSADAFGLDGVFLTTFVMLGVALLPLAHLRSYEHVLPGGQVELA